MLKLGVIFGGKSTEHDVSVVSGISVVKNLDKTKYDIQQIYINKAGEWYLHEEYKEKIKIGEKLTKLTKIEDVIEYLKTLDVIFPVLHGKNGEDGTIQGLFEIVGVPYVGCKVLSSSVGMDKVYTKTIFEKAKLKQVEYVYIRKYKEDYIYINKDFQEHKKTLQQVMKIIENELNYPMFVKPSNSGSSVGINKVKNQEELKNAIEYAAQFDTKILIEQGVEAREIECAILGTEEAIASELGEVLPAEEFYSFDAKYHNSASITSIPANLPESQKKEIQTMAIRAFKAIDGSGLARVDFFLEEKTGKIYLNEINTLPGFTEISMYSKLWEASGISYSVLLEKLIELALEEK